MKKLKPKTSRPCTRSPSRDRRTARTPAHRERLDPLEAALGAAARIAAPYPEEAESIDNVIRFVRDHRHGQPAEVRLSDVLLALATILGATDHNLTPEERDMLSVLEASLGIATRDGTVCVPGVAHPPMAARRCARRASCYVPAPITPARYVRIAA